MAKSSVLTALDIGSSRIRAVVATVDERRNIVNIIGVGSAPSEGVRKGRITDIEEAAVNISTALEEAERMSGRQILNAYTSVSGPFIRTDDCQGVVAINGQNAEITENDVDRVIDAARSVSMPANREILKILPKRFAVDSQHGVKYPVGMSGIRLEVEAHIVSGETGAIRNLEKTLYHTGVNVTEVVPSMLACSESVLDRKQKDLGCVLIEIGACSTNVVVYEEGTVLYSAVLPVGGEHVTNDLAIGLRCAVDTAEQVKLKYGTADPADVSDRYMVDLGSVSNTDIHTVEGAFIAKIIEARYYEIFMLVKDELQQIGRDGMLPAGAVLCGGGVKVPGLVELSREVLGLPVKIGTPKDIEGILDRAQDPAYSSVIGLLHYAHRHGVQRSFWDFNMGGAFRSVMDFFKSLLP
ncbi:cell division protein FtsA [Candidatus Peribacteria bacterium]|nr:cell division protein FtsA [Candidatus Peribacteria bacterium]